MKEMNRKIEGLTDSVIRRMTRIAMECGAINLSQGFPDFDPPEFIMKRLAEVATAGPHQYSPTWGAYNYRAAVAKKVGMFMGMELDPAKNDFRGEERDVTAEGGKVKILVIPTNEELMIAMDTAEIVNAK